MAELENYKQTSICEIGRKSTKKQIGRESTKKRSKGTRYK